MPFVLPFVERRRRRMPLVWVNNKRKHAHQMRANAYASTRFSTRVCAKMVRAFCVCVGRLSLTCTVDNPAVIKQSKKLRNLFKLNSIEAKLKQTTTVANCRPETHTTWESKLGIGQWANFVTAREQKAIKAIFTIFSSEFKTSDVLNTWLQKKWCAQTWLCVWPRSIYQYSDMAARLSGQKCLSIPKRDLNTRKHHQI